MATQTIGKLPQSKNHNKLIAGVAALSAMAALGAGALVMRGREGSPGLGLLPNIGSQQEGFSSWGLGDIYERTKEDPELLKAFADALGTSPDKLAIRSVGPMKGLNYLDYAIVSNPLGEEINVFVSERFIPNVDDPWLRDVINRHKGYDQESSSPIANRNGDRLSAFSDEISVLVFGEDKIWDLSYKGSEINGMTPEQEAQLVKVGQALANAGFVN